jgi:4'-phosphopantetheinyl transferase
MLVRVLPLDFTAAPPPDGEARVHFIHPHDLPLPMAELESLLTPDERDRAARYKAGTVREQFVVSRGVLRRLLGGCLNCAPHAVPIRYEGSGKPMLGCSSFHFNVSHTHGLMMLAIAHRRIGVDVERTRSIPDAAGLVERFFSPAERQCYRSLLPEQRARAFFRGWVCKEAVIKAAGATVQYLDGFDVELDPGREPAVLAVRHESLAGEGWMVADWEPEPGFAAAVAVEGHEKLGIAGDCRRIAG